MTEASAKTAPKPALSPSQGEAFRYARVSAEETEMGIRDLSTDAQLVLLAVCIARQQQAGFGTYLDLREVPCRECGAAGFNTGWGYWDHACGAEYLSDGTESEPCPRIRGETFSAQGAEGRDPKDAP